MRNGLGTQKPPEAVLHPLVSPSPHFRCPAAPHSPQPRANRHALCTPHESMQWTHIAERDMERNANDTFGNQNTSDASSGAGFGGTSGQPSQAGSHGNAAGPAGASFSRDASGERNVADRARGALSDAGSTVRDRAGNLKNSL